MSEKYAFIDAEYATRPAAGPAPTITMMCCWLGVSKSGFYDWRARPASPTARRRELLKIKVKALFDASRGAYGYRRVHAELVRGGERAGPELVRGLMRELGLVACQPRPWRRTTWRDPAARPAAGDLLGRDFTAAEPGAKLVGDITYVRTWEGWPCLATVIDCFNREVVGYAMAGHARTSLVTAALEMAARNGRLGPEPIFHSDRGCQGGFNRWSQHLDMEVSDGTTTGLDGGPGGAPGDAFAGPPAGVAA